MLMVCACITHLYRRSPTLVVNHMPQTHTHALYELKSGLQQCLQSLNPMLFHYSTHDTCLCIFLSVIKSDPRTSHTFKSHVVTRSSCVTIKTNTENCLPIQRTELFLFLVNINFFSSSKV